MHPFQHKADNLIVPKYFVEKGNDRDDDKRWQDGRNDCDDGSDDTSQLISDDDGSVDRNGSGRGLGDGHQIQHLFLFNPVIFIYKFFLH